jgi:hypothetical protein
MVEAMNPPLVGLEICLTSALLFSVALSFLCDLKKSKRIFCYLGLLTLPSAASTSLGETLLPSLAASELQELLEMLLELL